MNARGARHGYCPRDEPLFKGRFPRSCPEAYGQGLPQCAPGFPFYDMGARPHTSYKLARSAKKANRRARSVQPSCGYSPFHLHHNQRSRRQTTAQGAGNRPAVACPLSFATTGGPTSSMGAQDQMSYASHAGSWV
jgi:hypothetical protein